VQGNVWTPVPPILPPLDVNATNKYLAFALERLQRQRELENAVARLSADTAVVQSLRQSLRSDLGGGGSSSSDSPNAEQQPQQQPQQPQQQHRQQQLLVREVQEQRARQQGRETLQDRGTYVVRCCCHGPSPSVLLH
jgi:hypothetical protein